MYIMKYEKCYDNLLERYNLGGLWISQDFKKYTEGQHARL
jgi:hypothetical protein